MEINSKKKSYLAFDCGVKKRGNKERKSDCGTLKKRRGTCKLVIDALLAACTWIWRDVVGVASCRDGKIRSFFHGKVPFVAW